MARVLVIDDNATVRGLLAALLRAAGHEARVAAGGVEGLRSLRAAGAGVVLCGLLTPDMGGLGLLGALQAEAPGVPVVLVTSGGAVGGLDAADAAALLGAAGVLSRPFGPGEPAEAVRRALARAACAASPTHAPACGRRGCAPAARAVVRAPAPAGGGKRPARRAATRPPSRPPRGSP
jgi:DNA-binding NtrC family response regulator